MRNTAKHELREMAWLFLSNRLPIATARCPLGTIPLRLTVGCGFMEHEFWADGVPYPRPKIGIDASSISAALHRAIIEWATAQEHLRSWRRTGKKCP
jgi:hypothetical protein